VLKGICPYAHDEGFFLGGGGRRCRKFLTSNVPVRGSGLDDRLRSLYSGKQPHVHIEYRAGCASVLV